MEIVVVRGAGDKAGDPIVDPLLATEPAAISRGRAVIDANYTAKKDNTLTLRFTKGIVLGQLVQVHDLLLGITWYAKVKGVTHTITGVRGKLSAKTVLQLELSTDYY